MSNNSPTARTTPWAKYREQRLKHTRELRKQLAEFRDAPRCSACSIVIALRPADAPCGIAACPLMPFTVIAAPKSENAKGHPLCNS